MPDSQSRNPDQISIRGLFALVAVVALAMACYSAIAGFAIPNETSNQIIEGLTREQVLQIAGKPHQTDGSDWYYRVWNGFVPYSDMMLVGFDKNGEVDCVSF